MTKTVFRYFFDFVDGQEKWLNQMAEKGYRLKKCGKAWYTFERCQPSEYEYAVEFVEDKSYRSLKDYKTFLENMGYRTFTKNINLNFSFGKAKWRPWAKGMGQIATSPGSFNRELLIVEKSKDGKPIDLHTDLKDLLSGYRTLQKAYLWGATQMLALAIIVFILLLNENNKSLSVFNLRFYLVIVTAILGVLWSIPIFKYSKIIGKLKQESKTYE